MSKAELETRIAALEEMLTHQARAIEELSAQLHQAEQARTTLEQHQKALLERLQQVEDTQPASTSLLDEKPPHY